jgi:quercetin dioxygenase-like cupin family protein
MQKNFFPILFFLISGQQTQCQQHLNQIFQIETTPFWPNTPKNGTYFRFVQIPPDSQILEKAIELKKGSKEFKHNPSDPHPLMHKTDTLDYIIILSGELYLITEEKETLLKAGDIVIQRGTNHAWSNRSDQVCIQLAILIDAKK